MTWNEEEVGSRNAEVVSLMGSIKKEYNLKDE